MTAAEFLAQQHRTARGAGRDVPKITRFSPTEQAFARLLEQRQREKEIAGWAYRPFVLWMDQSFYVPRFAVLEPDGLLLIELREKLEPLVENPETLMRVAAQHWPKYDYAVLARRGKGFELILQLPEGEGSITPP